MITRLEIWCLGRWWYHLPKPECRKKGLEWGEGGKGVCWAACSPRDHCTFGWKCSRVTAILKISLVGKIAPARLGGVGVGVQEWSLHVTCCFNTALKLPLVGPAITSGHEGFAMLVATSHLWAPLGGRPFPGKAG